MVFPVDKEKIKEKRLKDVLEAGTGLLNPPSTEELLGLLDKSKNLMVYMEQSNSDTTKRALLPLRNALRLPELFGALDMDVKMSVISCISEMMRITAPEPPYDDDVLTEFFELFVPSLACLSQNSTTSGYRKAALILEVAAEVRFCVLMVELKLEKLIVEMFQLFMKTIRSDHPDTVFKHMEAIMTLVIQESDDEISLELLNSLLDSVKKDTMKISPASWKLGERVLKNVADILKPSIQEAVHSSAISLGDYSEIVTSMCENGSTGKENHICGSREHVQVNHTDPAEKSPGTQADEKITENKTDQPSLETLENESKLESRTNQDEVAEISTLNDSASTEIRQAAEDITKSATVNGTTSPNRNGETILIENTVEQLGPCQLSESIKSVPVHDDPETDELDPTKSLKQETNANTPKKRDWKPNTRMLPDEGYSHYWDSTNSSEKIKYQAIEPPGSSPKVSKIGGSPDGSRRKRGRPKKNKITLNEDGNINSSPVPNVDFHEARVKEKTQVSVDVSVKKEPDDTSYLEEKQDYLTGKQEKDSAGGKETDSVMTDLDKQLIGKRIKVWWPLDKRFYIGVVHSFDLKKMKHKVIYLDDEEELLNLRRERWELIGNDVSLDGEQEADDLLETNVSSCEPKRRRRRKSESAGQAKTGSSLKRGRPPKKPKVDSEPIRTYIDKISNGEKSIGTCSKSTIPETVVDDPQTCTGSGSRPTAPDDVIASKDEDPQKSIGTSSKPTTPNTTTVPKEREADLPKPNASSDVSQKKKRNRKTESVEQAETGSKPKKRGRPPRKNKAEVDNAPESPVTEGKGNDGKSANTISKAATPETVIASSRVEDPQKSTGTESKPTTPETPIASKAEIPQKSTGAGSKPTTPDTVIVPKEREADLPVASNASSYISPKKKRNRKSMSVGEANTDSPKKRGRPPRNPKVEVDSETDNPVTDGKGNGEMTTGTCFKPTKSETVIESKAEDPQKSSGASSKPTTPNTAVVPKKRQADRPEHNTSSHTPPPKKKRNRKSGPLRPDNSGTPKKSMFSRGRPPKNPKVDEVDSKPEKPIGSDSKAEEPVKTTVTSSKPGALGTVVACKAEWSRDESESTSSIQENASGSDERERE